MRRQLGVVAYVVLLTLMASMSGVAAPIALPQGTPVTVCLPQMMVSGRQHIGDLIELTCDDTVIAPTGEILIAKGAKVVGTVTKSQKAAWGGKRGAISFTISNIETAGGGLVPVRWTIAKTGSSKDAQEIADGYASGGLMGAAVSALIGPGQDVVIPRGLEFVIYTDQPVTVEVPAPPATRTQPLEVVGQPTLIKGSAEGEKTLLGVFTLRNPNTHAGLRQAHVTVTATSAGGAEIRGTNLPPFAYAVKHDSWKFIRFRSVGSYDPDQCVPLLEPGETRTYVKPVRLFATKTLSTEKGAEGGKGGGGQPAPAAECHVHVGQAWVSTDYLKQLPWPRCTVASPSLDQKSRRVLAEVRSAAPHRVSIEVCAVVVKEGEVVGAGRGIWTRVAPGKTYKVAIPIVGKCEGDVQVYADVAPWEAK